MKQIILTALVCLGMTACAVSKPTHNVCENLLDKNSSVISNSIRTQIQADTGVKQSVNFENLTYKQYDNKSCMFVYKYSGFDIIAKYYYVYLTDK